MGNISDKVNSNMKANMDAQMNFQKEIMLKQRQTQLAMQIAMGRERFWYYQWFYYVAVVGCLAGGIMKKNPQLMAPIVPLSFAYAFQYDMLYGNMFERAQIVADDLLMNDPNKFLLPAHSGIVTSEQYNALIGIKDGKKII